MREMRSPDGVALELRLSRQRHADVQLAHVRRSIRLARD
jgi:hypothetical protein